MDVGGLGRGVTPEALERRAPAGIPECGYTAWFRYDTRPVESTWRHTTADKTTICRLLRIDWDTAGRIITRVMADSLDPGRLRELFEIRVDEVSWRKRNNYLTGVDPLRRTA